MADGIIFERLGVPAVSIVTDAFVGSSNAMARLQGAPGYRYTMVSHPLSNLTPDECQQRADEVLSDVSEILGLADGQTGTVDTGAVADAVAASASTAAPGAVRLDDLTEDHVRDLCRIIEYYYTQEWTDGLPVVPATAAAVREFVDYVGRDPGEQVVTVAHFDRTCTVELAAVAAVMAGCQKEHFPVLLAAAETTQDSVTTGLLQSTSGQAQLIVVNGPVRRRLGFNAAGSVFGPGYRANATVGRALRLISMNAFGIRPGSFDQSTQATPAKYTLCIAENEEDSPWEPLHAELGFPADSDVVTTHFARSTLHVDRVSNQPEEVLLTIADSMSYAGAAGHRAYVVVMGPEHARMLGRNGWSKQQAKQFLWEHWGRPQSELSRLGLLRKNTAHTARFDPLSVTRTDADAGDGFLRFGESPESILLVVAGANNASVSTVIPSLRPIFRSKEIPAGRA